MAWARLDDGFHENLKLVRVGLAARGLYAAAISWSAKHMTDGFLPDDVIPTLAAGEPADALLAKLCEIRTPYKTGCFVRVADGYEIHDFLTYNPSKASVVKQRKADQKRQKAWRKRHAVTDACVTDLGGRVTPGRVGTGSSECSSSVLVLSSEGGVGGGGFEDFWAAYPNKVGKQKAREAWDKLAPGADLGRRIVMAVGTQKGWARWRREGGQYIPNPTTWLNQGRWDDQPNEAPPQLMSDQNAEAGRVWLERMRRRDDQR